MASPARELSYDPDKVCVVCGKPIKDQGLGFYEHVENDPSCYFRWQEWMAEVAKDHGGD